MGRVKAGSNGQGEFEWDEAHPGKACEASRRTHVRPCPLQLLQCTSTATCLRESQGVDP